MSKKEFNDSLLAKIPMADIGANDPAPELTEELRENVEGIIILVVLCDIVPWLILTMILVGIFPPLTPLGVIPIGLSINRFLKNFQKLEKLFKD